ncbi:uncharacterized protein LOC114917063 [Cajanus cajan]|uniref:uncharacterized protein LOC114917063 n=1 Tax=Cajanus cajan TaxID=3821 RepID=UPI0010FB289F|nr:uncharacterized protein LOC114917063 [Cajanus cajan]
MEPSGGHALGAKNYVLRDTQQQLTKYLEMSTISLRSILADGKLVGSNFDEQATNAYKKYLEDYMSTKCLLLASMSSELQRQHEDMDQVDIINHLKKMYGGQSRTARFQLSKTLFRSTLTANAEVGPHVLKMISLIEQLEKSGCKLGKELSQDLILQSLPGTFSQFIVNFNMNKMDCDLHEMLNLLIDYENQIASEKSKGTVMVVGKSNSKKGKGTLEEELQEVS